jgi:co-chaperonin GroES (HSP10)
MNPTVGNVFVEKANQKKTFKKFEVVDNSEASYQVTKVGQDVVACRKGDFVLFTDYKTYKFQGKDIYIVKESDIVAVKTNSEIKK